MKDCEIKFFCSWWGLDHLGVELMVRKIAEADYDGIEVGIPQESSRRNELRQYLEKHNLEVIAHQYQAEGKDFKSYAGSLKKSLETAAAFQPLFINSHTGKDHWTTEQNVHLVGIGEEIEDKYNIPVIHETHRGRFLYSTSASREYFNQLPALRINADLSHWTCVSESLLEDQGEIVEEAIRRAEHIHARVGYAEGPQVPDPFAPDWKEELSIFMGWWKRILARFREEGRAYLTVTPEWGPPPYTWCVPGTGAPLLDFWEVNLNMMHYLKKNLPV